MRTRRRALVTLVLTSLVAACSGDDAATADAAAIDGPTIDAPPACATRVVDESLGTITTAMFGAVSSEQSMTNPNLQLLLFATIDGMTPAPIDVFEIRLFQGATVFDPDFVTGTFDISGIETDFYECGACVHILGDFDGDAGTTEQDLVASSGTLTLDMVSGNDGETVSGTLTDVVLRQVDLNDTTETQSAIPGGCETSLDSITFSATVQAIGGRRPVTDRPRSARTGLELMRLAR